MHQTLAKSHGVARVGPEPSDQHHLQAEGEKSTMHNDTQLVTVMNDKDTPDGLYISSGRL